MNYQYKDHQTKGQFMLGVEQQELARYPYQEKLVDLLTIAWNRGPAQSVSVDGVEYTLNTGEVILLVYAHTYHFENANHIVSWRFNREFYCVIDHDAEVSCAGLIFYGVPSPMRLVLDEKHQDKLNLLFLIFVDEFNYADKIQGEMLRTLLKRLIIILTRLAKIQHLEEASNQSSIDILRQFNQLVEQHYASKHQVADYAALLYKSPKTLSNVFRQHSSFTPLQIIQNRIALEAKRRLLYTQDSISEIANDLGYLENAHFSRFFKKMEGISPKVFRETAIGKN